MKFSDKFIRNQLEIARPIAHSASLDTARPLQEKAGRVMQFLTRRDTVRTNEDFNGIPGALLIPKDEVRSGVILYLHGGGYVSGGLEYAAGFASVLAAECGMRVVTCAYGLAPENVYPCQINEVVTVYRQLLNSGYSAESIILVGESAGGALTFALSMKLRELDLPMPAGIIAISPWCDLTHSGESHITNKEKDPSLTKEVLEFYANSYVGISDVRRINKAEKLEIPAYLQELKKEPMVSPVFADLTGLPPTLIFAGGDEILLSDAERMHERLSECGVPSKLVVRDQMWHAYHLYRLKSSDEDFVTINKFIKAVLPRGSQRKLRWMSLDNAAKIYPAARSARWTNVFRLSATLKEDVDRRVLQSAIDVTVRRFPSIAVRLRRGAFWYYLEEIAHAPTVTDEKSYPLVRMPFDDIRSCAFRVIVYKKRIAVEFFHALTDGNGGLVFLKSLVAEYLTQKYGISIPATDGVLDRIEIPSEEELVDCFPKYAGKVAATRRDSNSYRIYGTAEPDRYSNVTTFMIKSKSLLELAHKYNVTVTAVLVAALIKAAIGLQNEDVQHLKLQKPIKVLVPCDLRRMYNTRTLRNFALYATPGIDPRLGEYSFGEICDIVYRQMKLEITPKIMSARIKTNVKDEENMFLKLTPLFLKNIVMKAVFEMVGEKKSMLTLSNLGVVTMPEIMREYVERMDFVLSVQSRAPYNVGALSYGDTTNISIIRNIKEARLESALYKTLRQEGIAVKVESNQR
ncbi:MAG: alpha/beta hydrolase fold domain-containing protein [Clostridia bacterium]|nr:alpha/beta hydrolase fold domain-containing protein [Clostridia bacterium]